MQTVNLLTIELQLRVERSNNLLSLFQLKNSFKKPYLFFKNRFKVFFGWPTLARFFLFFPVFQRVVTSRRSQ